MIALTVKQKLFVNEYLKDKNATKAAIRAGYSTKRADVAGSTLMSKPDVKAEIARRVDKICDKVDVSIERIVSELAAIAFTNTKELVDDEGFIKPNRSEVAEKAIAGIKQTKDGVQLMSYDKTKALELLGKYRKMFVDRTVNENVEMPLETYLKRVEDDNEY